MASVQFDRDGLHLGDLALVQDHAADQLHVEVPLAKRTLGRLQPELSGLPPPHAALCLPALGGNSHRAWPFVRAIVETFALERCLWRRIGHSCANIISVSAVEVLSLQLCG